MSSDAALLGRWGEKQAAGYLHQKGYRLLAAGYRCRMGEIDLIAQKGTYYQLYTGAFEYGEHYCRFDVAEVYAPDGLQTAKPEIRYYEHAFW